MRILDANVPRASRSERLSRAAVDLERAWLVDREFLATHDFREATSLAGRRAPVPSRRVRLRGLADCVPLANWGHRRLVALDPRGRIRGGEPATSVMLNADEVALDI